MRIRGLCKKAAAVFMSGLMIAGLAGCGGSGSSKKAEENGYADTLNIYMWSEYIPESIFTEFEQETGIHVVPAYYASNDELIAKVTSGAGSQYDLIQPSIYKLPILTKGDYIEKMDMNNIPNYKNLDENYQDIEGYEDAKDYYIPYMMDREYIVYNTDTCPIEIKSLNDLKNPKLKNSLVFTAGTNLITLGLCALGIDPFTTDEKDYEKAYEWAKDVYPNVKVIDGDSPKSQFMNGEVVAGQIYSGDLALLMESMDNIKIAEVKEKMGSSADCWAIPKGAKHKKEAEAFLNFLLEPEHMAECLNSYPYISVMSAATDLAESSYKDSIVHQNNDYNKNGFYVNKYTGMEDTLDKYWTKLSAK